MAALLGRLPFLSAGFGIDSDAWRVALAGRYVRTTGTYGSSRVPGHPVQDLVAAALHGLGPLGLNGATAVFSLVAIWAFHRLARRFAVPHPLALTLAFAFLPLVYLQSVDALDYLWALAFVLAAVEAFFADRLVLAGILIGLATGCRITSFAMVLPLLAIAAPGTRMRALVRMGLVAFAVAGLCYVPVLATYGPGYLRVTPTPYPRPAFLLKEMSLDVFGLLGLAGLAYVLTAEAWARLRGSRPTLPGAPRLWVLSGLVIAGYLALFLRLPDDAAYLLPAVPFVLLALATLLSPRRVLVLCIFLTLSGLVFKLRDAGRIGGPAPSRLSVALGPRLALDLPGPIFADHRRRISEEAFADSALTRISRLPEGSVVYVADWYPMLTWKSADPAIVQYPTDRQLASGAPIWYLPGVEDDVRAKTGIDLEAAGGRVLDPRDARAPRP